MAKAPFRPRRAARPSLPSLELEIFGLDDDGYGTSRHEGKDVLVFGALPGEKVAVAIEHEGKRRLIGHVLRVLTPSPERVPSSCAHAKGCQGCPLIALGYPAQLRFKQERIERALAAHPSLKNSKIHPIWGASQPIGYRTNSKLAFARERGKVRLGLYRRGTHEVVDIGNCPLHHPLINRVATVVREEVERQEVYIYNPMRGTGLLRYLAVKVSPAQGKAMVTFVTAERNFREITHLAKWLKKKVPEVVSVQQNVNASEGNVIFGRENLKVLGAPDLIDQVGEVRLRIGPTSFFQVNNEQAARIYALVRKWGALTAEETAVDLYCGIGGIALHLAKDAGRVIGIEAVEEAVRNARENARFNGQRNCQFLAGDAAELIQDLAFEVPQESVVVVNPPRGGCAPEVLHALTALAPRMVLYVSCNPETLSRDLDLLHQDGYRTEEIQPVDMFPQTPHVEAVARLVPAGTKGRRKKS